MAERLERFQESHAPLPDLVFDQETPLGRRLDPGNDKQPLPKVFQGTIHLGRIEPELLLKLAETLGLTDTIRAIPIVEPEAVHEIGLVVPAREPMTALNAALVTEARKLASTLDPPAAGVLVRRIGTPA